MTTPKRNRSQRAAERVVRVWKRWAVLYPSGALSSSLFPTRSGARGMDKYHAGRIIRLDIMEAKRKKRQLRRKIRSGLSNESAARRLPSTKD